MARVDALTPNDRVHRARDVPRQTITKLDPRAPAQQLLGVFSNIPDLEFAERSLPDITWLIPFFGLDQSKPREVVRQPRGS